MTATDIEPTYTSGASHYIAANQARETATIGVDLPTTTPVVVRQINIGPVHPGNLIRVYAEAGVTNDTGLDKDRKLAGQRFTVGVGWYLAANNPGNRIGLSRGMNVTPDMHHLAIDIERLWQVPSTWPPGQNLDILLMVDAHSTKWNVNAGKPVLRNSDGLEVLKVDNYGQIIAERWAI